MNMLTSGANIVGQAVSNKMITRKTDAVTGEVTTEPSADAWSMFKEGCQHIVDFIKWVGSNIIFWVLIVIFVIYNYGYTIYVLHFKTSAQPEYLEFISELYSNNITDSAKIDLIDRYHMKYGYVVLPKEFREMFMNSEDYKKKIQEYEIQVSARDRRINELVLENSNLRSEKLKLIEDIEYSKFKTEFENEPETEFKINIISEIENQNTNQNTSQNTDQTQS